MMLQRRVSAANIETFPANIPPQIKCHTYCTGTPHTLRNIAPTHHTPHAHLTRPSTCNYSHSTQNLNITNHNYMRALETLPKHAQTRTRNASTYPSSCHRVNSRAQPRHSNRSASTRVRAISNLRRSQGVTTTTKTRPLNVIPPLPASPEKPCTCP